MSKTHVVSLLACLLSTSAMATYTTEANSNWQPIVQAAAIETGSALDLSSWGEAPAGKHGSVIATPTGEFAFKKQPGKSIRFRGANLSFEMNYLAKEDAEALAIRFRKMGYNAVRIHHQDVLLAGGWHPTEYVINEDQIDKLDYLFHCMKEQGLYVSTDLFTIRRIPTEALKKYDIEKNHSAFKAVIPLVPEAMVEWKRFARDFLAHKNPYTGMTWAEDPALFSICPVNEDTLFEAHTANPQVEKLTQNLFNAWCKEKTLTPNKDLLIRFLTEKHLAADQEMKRFLKEELGVQALITGSNWMLYQTQTILRSEYDYVDNHSYWNHPGWSTNGAQRLPYHFPQWDAVERLAASPRELFLTRVKNKPFAVTEFNFCFPNFYRDQMGPLIGTYAALQDWNALFHFNWGDGLVDQWHDGEQIIRGFDLYTDPINLLGESIIGFFWQRGDVPVLQDEKTFVVTDQSAFAAQENGKPVQFPHNATLLGLTHRVNSIYQSEAKASVNRDFENLSKEQRYEVEQDDCRVVIQKTGDFLVSTPTSMALVLKTESLDDQFVTEFNTPATVFCGAIDNQPLEKSKRLLIMHLTNVVNSDMKFRKADMEDIEAHGHLPLLVQRGTAQLAIPNQAKASQINVYALDLSGKRLKPVDFSVNPKTKRIEFTAETIQTDGTTCLVYEVMRTR